MRFAGMNQRVSNKLTALGITAILLAQPITMLSLHTYAAGTLSGDVRITVTPEEIDKLIPIQNGHKTVNMALHGVSVRDAFVALAKQAGFSVMVDESVDGSINVDLNNVSVQDALETLKTFGNLTYSVQQGQLVVTKADSDKAKYFQHSHSKVIPLHYATAGTVSAMLNQVLYAGQGTAGSQGGGQGRMKVSHDFQTNSLIVVGTPNDIRTVEEHVKALDVARESKTWRLSHANALDVASLLSSTLFNEGTPPLSLGGSASAASGQAGQVPQNSSSISVRQEKVQEGTGGSATAANSGTSNAVTLRARVKEDQTVQISPSGPIILPDTRMNTITLMGTAEQIAMAEALIPTLDRKLPQVVLDATMIEITETQRKELLPHIGGQANQVWFGHRNLGAANTVIPSTARSHDIGILTSATSLGEAVLGYTTNPIRKLREDFNYQLDALARQRKLKILANPTVTAIHDSDVIISMVDEVIKKVTTTTDSAGVVSGVEAEIGEVGVVLNMIPRIGANGTVSLKVHPTISSIGSVTTDTNGNVITLLSKRDMLAQNVVLKDGESFILGGLVNSNDSKVNQQIPLLSNLPIAGALARSSDRNHSKSEIIIIITPHIMNDENAVAQSSSTSAMKPVNLQGNASELQGSFVPVSHSTPSTYSNPSSLPALEPARTLSTPTNTSGMELRSHKSALPWKSSGYTQAYNMLMSQDENQKQQNKKENIRFVRKTGQKRTKSLSSELMPQLTADPMPDQTDTDLDSVLYRYHQEK